MNVPICTPDTQALHCCLSLLFLALVHCVIIAVTAVVHRIIVRIALFFLSIFIHTRTLSSHFSFHHSSNEFYSLDCSFFTHVLAFIKLVLFLYRNKEHYSTVYVCLRPNADNHIKLLIKNASFSDTNILPPLFNHIVSTSDYFISYSTALLSISLLIYLSALSTFHMLSDIHYPPHFPLCRSSTNSSCSHLLCVVQLHLSPRSSTVVLCPHSSHSRLRHCGTSRLS